MNGQCGKWARLTTAIISAGLVSGASASDSMWYAGVGVGQVFVDRNVSDFDDGSVVSGRVDSHDTGYNLFVGYRFQSRLAVELGYVDLNNDVDNETSFTGVSDGSGTSFTNGAVSVDIDEPVGIYAAMVGSIPLSSSVMLNGRLGAMSWEADETVIDSAGERKRKRDGAGGVAGLGLEYRFENQVALRGGWDFFNNLADEDYDLISVSALFSF